MHTRKNFGRYRGSDARKNWRIEDDQRSDWFLVRKFCGAPLQENVFDLHFPLLGPIRSSDKCCWQYLFGKRVRIILLHGADLPSVLRVHINQEFFSKGASEGQLEQAWPDSHSCQLHLLRAQVPRLSEAKLYRRKASAHDPNGHHCLCP